MSEGADQFWSLLKHLKVGNILMYVQVFGAKIQTYKCTETVPPGGSSVNPITTRGADYAHHITASPPGFENPAAAL